MLPEQKQRGHDGERQAYRLLCHNMDLGTISFFCQPDFVVMLPNGRVQLLEVKNQEAFVAPPFDGHGLPPVQAERYEKLRANTGIETFLLVYEPTTGRQYIGSLGDLEAGPRFDTNGSSPRRVYALQSFQLLRGERL